MSKAGAQIVEGLRDALAHARGDRTAARVHVIRVPARVDVARVRKRLGLSQAAFAREFGFPVATVRDWEQKRRTPMGAARVLLTLIEREPEAVTRALWHGGGKASPAQRGKANRR